MNDDENNNPQHNYGKSALRDFLENLNNGDLPKGWQETEIGKRVYEKGHLKGHQEGYMKGLRDAWDEANVVIDSFRNIIKLHDQRFCDYDDE